MPTTTIKILPEGFNAYRKSPEVVAALEAIAAGIVAEAQANVDADPAAAHFPTERPDVVQRTVQGRDRARVYVSTDTHRGALAEHSSRALNRAVQAHGGTA